MTKRPHNETLKETLVSLLLATVVMALLISMKQPVSSSGPSDTFPPSDAFHSALLDLHAICKQTTGCQFQNFPKTPTQDQTIHLSIGSGLSEKRVVMRKGDDGQVHAEFHYDPLYITPADIKAISAFGFQFPENPAQ